jgi:hypothetical protein
VDVYIDEARGNQVIAEIDLARAWGPRTGGDIDNATAVEHDRGTGSNTVGKDDIGPSEHDHGP